MEAAVIAAVCGSLMQRHHVRERCVPHVIETYEHFAQHFLAAAPIGTAGKAIEYLRRAGDRASSQLAYEEAVRLYETALPLVDEATTRCELLLALAQLCELYTRAVDALDVDTQFVH